jgi:hypothetical protein
MPKITSSFKGFSQGEIKHASPTLPSQTHLQLGILKLFIGSFHESAHGNHSQP